MAGLCAMASDKTITTRLSGATDAHDAWEIIDSEKPRSYNYFLED